MAGVRTFRDLIAWQKAMQLVRTIYAATQAMPPDERFGLTMQMRRAAVSVPSNIAEGHGRRTSADYLRFLRNARGSLFELMTQYELASRELGLLRHDAAIDDSLAECDRILQGLIRSMEDKI